MFALPNCATHHGEVPDRSAREQETHRILFAYKIGGRFVQDASAAGLGFGDHQCRLSAGEVFQYWLNKPSPVLLSDERVRLEIVRRMLG